MLKIHHGHQTQRPASPKSLKGGHSLRHIAAIALILLSCLLPAQEGMAKARAKAAEGPNNKYASIVIDADTGVVVSESNADKKLHPASLTKVMTLLLLFEAMERGSVRLNDRIMISQRAAAQQPSKLGLTAGSSIRVEDAILAVVTKSANDITVAIAEHLAGSESRFAQKMTSRAHSIGMNSTTFRNASGLHNPAQVSSARDMATLARYVIHRYPNYYRYFGTKQFTYRGKTMTNHNRLMNTYPGMDGFKTGFINPSGFNLIASAKHGNNRLIGVVFGGRTSKTRNDHMAELLNKGFRNVDSVRLAKAPKPILSVEPAALPVREARAPSAGSVVSPPPVKPVFKTTSGTPAPNTLQLPPQYAQNQQLQPARPTDQSFTSLSSLDTSRRLTVAQAPVQGFAGDVALPEPDPAAKAAQEIKSAINRGEYSEVTGEGDFDGADTRRLEAGLLSAALYKGDYKPKAPNASPAIIQPVSAIQGQALQQPAVTPTASSDLWSVQIGAYASRVATDDALMIAKTKLPASLSHASRIVAPLESGAGYLFRARLGGLTKEQAIEACRYFRDCLPVAPQ